ncbi:MAG: hypothetical protein M3Q18_13215 [Actinomycetota bacterium]|nr:hypothetical protein [Actinomycetota bacterium]
MSSRLSTFGLLVALAFGLGAIPESSARLNPPTKTYRAEVALHPELPTTLTEDEDDAAWGVASFGRPFSSLEGVCISVRFSGDLLDPAETFHFLHFYFRDGLVRYGHTNAGPAPLESTGPSCFVPDTNGRELRAFEDGRQRLTFTAPRGSVRISRVVVTATGTR